MEIRVPLLVKRLTQLARLPSKGSRAAAGYDLYSAEEGVVPARGKALIKTGISIAVPPGNYGRVAPRSGLAVKNFIDVGAGVIDEDYRGEVGVVLFNHSEVEFKINLGDRIAQLIIEKITETNIQEVESLDDTQRGAGGFGSTGVALNSDNNKIQPETVQTNGKASLKRKAPYGSVLSRDTLFKEAQETMNDEFQWKEWSVLVLYTLCESDMITVEEKKRWGDLVFSGQKKAYELLRTYVQGAELNLVKDELNKLNI